MDPTSNSAPIFSSGGAAPSGTGDVILSPTPAPTTGKSKKGIVAVIIILAVLVLGGLAFYSLVMPRLNNTGTSAERKIPAAIAEPLNKYGNYLLFGTDSTKFIDSMDNDDKDGQYQISIIKNKTAKEQEEYFAKLSALYTDFLSVVQEKNVDIDTDALSKFALKIKEYEDLLQEENADKHELERLYYMIMRSYREIKEELIREK